MEAGPSEDEEPIVYERNKIEKKISAPKLTPFQRYHEEKTLSAVRRSENLLQKEKPDLVKLMKEIKNYNMSDQELRVIIILFQE